MRLLGCIQIFLFTLAAALAQSDQEVVARKAVLELAGAFFNDGFELRDGHYSATLTKEKPVTVQVNLYAGDAYWFMAASADPAHKLAIAIFDEKGQPVQSKPYSDGSRVAANFSPQISGPYYIRLSATESAVFCLTYSYK